MKRPKITDPECKRLIMSDIPIVKYSKLQDKYIDYLEAQAKQLRIGSVVKQSELFECRNVACNKMVKRNSGTVFCKKHRNL